MGSSLPPPCRLPSDLMLPRVPQLPASPGALGSVLLSEQPLGAFTFPEGRAPGRRAWRLDRQACLWLSTPTRVPWAGSSPLLLASVPLHLEALSAVSLPAPGLRVLTALGSWGLLQPRLLPTQPLARCVADRGQGPLRLPSPCARAVLSSWLPPTCSALVLWSCAPDCP